MKIHSISRMRNPFRNDIQLKIRFWSLAGLAPMPVISKSGWQVRAIGDPAVHITSQAAWSVFVEWRQPCSDSVALLCFENTDEKFYIYSDVPHTHPARRGFFRKNVKLSKRSEAKTDTARYVHMGQAAVLSSRRKIAR